MVCDRKGLTIPRPMPDEGDIGRATNRSLTSMQIQRVNRTDAEKVYIVVTNADAATVTTGLGMTFCNAANGAAAGASVGGTEVLMVNNATSHMLNFAGIAAQDIAVGAAGRSQIWGYCDSVAVSHRGANTTIGGALIAETLLIPAALKGTFTSEAAQDALSVIGAGQGARFILIHDTVVLSLSLHSAGAYVYAKGFIRGL